LLVSISALGSFISLVIPTYSIGLLGIAPIVIGVKKLVTFRKKNESNSRETAQDKKKNNLAFAAVAAVTFQMAVTISVFIHHYLQNTMLQTKLLH
jgi:cadmium resistance protein CadD (predicted permease)